MKRLQSTTHADPTPGNSTLVVGVVWSEATLRAAQVLAPTGVGAPDVLELRVDAFARNPAGLDALEALVAGAAWPVIVTVRYPAEGGLDPALDLKTRRLLYERFLPVATFVDVEVRSLRALADVATRAWARGCRVIGSFHDFEGTPSIRRLRTLAARAAAGGADVFKVATTVRTPGDLASLLGLFGGAPLPLAVMGMGPLGKVSRLTLAAAGSALAYGYLGEGAQVPGQWPAGVLRERLDELGDGG